jgi:hypothetical protein
VLVPDQTCRPSKARQIDQLDGRSILDPRPSATTRTRRRLHPQLNVHDNRVGSFIVDTDDVDRWQADQHLAQARKVDLHRGSPDR